MKKAESFKGFETWFNNFSMTYKMYVYAFAIFIGFQVLIRILVNCILYGRKYSAFARYLDGRDAPAVTVRSHR